MAALLGKVAFFVFFRYTNIEPDFRSKMKKMVLNHLIKHHFYLL